MSSIHKPALKRNRHEAAPRDRLEQQIDYVFHYISAPVGYGSTLESHKNTAVSAVILCPAVCISDVMNKPRTCVKTIKYVMSQHFLLFTSKEYTSREIRSKKLLQWNCAPCGQILFYFIELTELKNNRRNRRM